MKTRAGATAELTTAEPTIAGLLVDNLSARMLSERTRRDPFSLLFVIAILAPAGNTFAQGTALDDYLATYASDTSISATSVATTSLPGSAPQGALVIGHAKPGATVVVDGRAVRVSDDGSFVFGIGRDAGGSIQVEIQAVGGERVERSIAVIEREWPIERVDGVPSKTVNPPPAIADRIRREQAMVVTARERDDDRDDYERPFIWPVHGRISGRFGNARIYNGQTCAAQACPGHSGMDIAVAQGTPVHAPAAGVVTFANPDLYLTGGTVLLDHGHGVSSNFLHLSRIDVEQGDRIEQGQVIGAVGATGRATGPHLHWGMNWFDVRVDPLLVLQESDVEVGD